MLDMTTPRSWFSRMADAIVGVIIGILFVIIAVILTFATEQFAVKLDLILGRAQKACVSNVPSATVNANLDCRMVHMQGETKIPKDKDARDEEFGHFPKEKSVVLTRKVEALQWKEHVEKTNDETRYTYLLEWVEEDIDSTAFKQTGVYFNPRRPAEFVNKTFYATTSIGAYTMSTEQMDKMKRWHPSVIDEASLQSVTGALKSTPWDGLRFAGMKQLTRRTRVEGQVQSQGEAYWSSIADDYQELPRVFLYLERTGGNGGGGAPGGYGATGTAGAAGDIRISYDVIREGPVSVIGVVQDDTFRPFTELDAHNVDGKLAKDPEQVRKALEAEQDSCFDPLFALLFESKHARTVLLVEERLATKQQMFDDEHKKFVTRLALLRIIAYLLLSVGIFLIFDPVAEIFSVIPFLGEHIKNIIAFLLAILSLVAGLILWTAFVGLAWCVNRPWIITLALTLAGACFYLAGGAMDGVWFDSPLPLHYSHTLMGEALWAVALVPLGFVVWGLVEEVRYGINVARLNEAAGIRDQ